MKVRSAIKLMCKHCYLVRRGKHRYVYCKKTPKHKQKQAMSTWAVLPTADAPTLLSPSIPFGDAFRSLLEQVDLGNRLKGLSLTSMPSSLPSSSSSSSRWSSSASSSSSSVGAAVAAAAVVAETASSASSSSSLSSLLSSSSSNRFTSSSSLSSVASKSNGGVLSTSTGTTSRLLWPGLGGISQIFWKDL